MPQQLTNVNGFEEKLLLAETRTDSPVGNVPLIHLENCTCDNQNRFVRTVDGDGSEREARCLQTGLAGAVSRRHCTIRANRKILFAFRDLEWWS